MANQGISTRDIMKVCDMFVVGIVHVCGGQCTCVCLHTCTYVYVLLL